MTDLRTLVEHEMERAGSPRYAIGDLVELRDRKRRHKRIAAGVVAIAIFAAPVALFALHAFDRTRTPATIGNPSSAPETGTLIDDSAPVPEAPGVDYVIDLNTNVVTPLPESILRSVVSARLRESDRTVRRVSSDGSRSRSSGPATTGTLDIRCPSRRRRDPPVTHDQTAPRSPAWSPDGRRSRTNLATAVAKVATRSSSLDIDQEDVTRQVIDGGHSGTPRSRRTARRRPVL